MGYNDLHVLVCIVQSMFFDMLQDFLGEMECSLGEIVSAGRLKRALK